MPRREVRLPKHRAAYEEDNTDADWLLAANAMKPGEYYTVHIPELGLADLIRRHPSPA